MITSLTIVDGPGRWDMMLAVFVGQPVHFRFAELEAQWLNDYPFEISGGHFYGSHGKDEREEFCFSTIIPTEPKEIGNGGLGILGTINLQTRKGAFEVGETEKICFNTSFPDHNFLPCPM